jgi:hypothetical protein
MKTVVIYYLIALGVITGVVGMALEPVGTTLSTIWFMMAVFSLGTLFVVAGFDVQSPRLAWILIITGMLFVLAAVYEVSF